MSGKTYLVLRLGLLLGFGLISNADAAYAALERPGFAITSLDGSGDIGQHSSVTIGTDGLALISYYDATNGDLKVAHCSNPICVPYHRRR